MSIKQILYILPQPFYVSRGSSFRAMATLEALSELGYQTDLLCFRSGPDVELPGLKIIRASDFGLSGSLPVGPSWRKLVLDLPLALKAFWLLLTKRYDVIHGVEEGGIVASFLGLIFGKPYIFDMHSWMSEQLANHEFMNSSWLLRMFTRLEMFCMKRAAAIITVGQHMAEVLKELQIDTPALVLYDLPLEMSVDPETQAAIRKQYVHDQDRILVYTGNFHSYQGIDLLLDSFKGLLSLYDKPNTLKLLLVGGGKGEAKHVDYYKNKVKQLQIIDGVIFCGERSLTEVQAFLECAEILVSPRVSGNNVPLKIYSYLAAGKLIVATDISSHTQVLNSTNALLAGNTPDQFARGLLQALTLSADIAQQLRENSKVTGNRARRVAEFVDVLSRGYQNIVGS